MGILALIFIFGIPGGLLIALLLYAISKGSGSSGGNSGCLGGIGSAFGSTLSIVGIFFAVFLFEDNKEFRDIIITIAVAVLVAIISLIVIMSIKKAKFEKMYNDKCAKIVKAYKQKYSALLPKMPSGYFTNEDSSVKHLGFDNGYMYYLNYTGESIIKMVIKDLKTDEKISEYLKSLLVSMDIKKVSKNEKISWFYEPTSVGGKIEITCPFTLICFSFLSKSKTKTLIDYLMKHIPDKRNKQREDIDSQLRMYR